MADNIVIIESPSKAKSYNKALGKDYEIVPSYGHCVDLPPSKLGINIRKKFDATFEPIEGKEGVIDNIKKKAKKAKNVFLMPDPDREGEAIAWHIYNAIKEDTKANILRATTNEISKKAIQSAINNPGNINMQMIDSYLCRRLLDRLCGYKTSFLTKQATGGTSAGRVQSAVLRIIAEREKEIRSFVPEEYWVLTAFLISSKGDPYVGVLDSKVKVKNEKQATEIYNKVKKGKPEVTSVVEKPVTANPVTPFTTSTMIQSSSSIFGWGAKKTSKVAQSLYEKGLITYMRTDSPVIAKDALGTIRSHIQTSYGDAYLPKQAKVYAAKKGAQEGHECCRPTNIGLIESGEGADERKLYSMIWKRTVASQMSPGKDKQIKVVTTISTYNFHSNGKIRLFDGYRKVWDYSKSEDVILPNLCEGEKCTLENLKKEQKFTTPPPRYSEGSITKTCEKLQIGRPSTYAQCIQTLIDRRYVQLNKKSLHATDLGIGVIDFLKTSDFCFVDIDFTAQMEGMLDDIANGDKDKTEVLTEFWSRLKADIENGNKVRLEQQKTDHKCPKCDGTLLKKHSTYGPFYACENYKAKDDDACKYIAQVGDEGQPIEKVRKEKEYADFPCKNCSNKMVKRKSQYGEFYGCEKYPKCKTIANMDGEFVEKKKTYKKRTKKTKKSKS